MKLKAFSKREGFFVKKISFQNATIHSHHSLISDLVLMFL